MLETCVKSCSFAGKYINIYSIQKHRTKSKAKRQVEISLKKSSVNKKKVKSNSFQVYLVQGLRLWKFVSGNTQFILVIISLRLICNLKMIGKCWSVLTCSPGKFDSSGEILNKCSMRRHKRGGSRLKLVGFFCKICDGILCLLDNIYIISRGIWLHTFL